MNVTKKTESTRLSWLPYMGIGAGMLTGIGSRVINGTSLWVKASSACRAAAFQGSGIFSNIFSAINSLKQWEIKNCSLATPLLPVLAQIAVDVVRDNQSSKRIFARIKDAVKKNFTLEGAVYLGAFAALGLTGPSYCSSLGMCSKTAFDASGHMMIKTLCAGVLSKGVSAIAKKERLSLRNAFNAIYAATDAVFIHNTVANCHTIPEILAGIGWGLCISSGAKLASRKIESLQNRQEIGRKIQVPTKSSTSIT